MNTFYTTFLSFYQALLIVVKGNINHKNLEQFHEFLRGYADIFTNNIYAAKDCTCHNLRGMIQNKDFRISGFQDFDFRTFHIKTFIIMNAIKI